MNEKLIADLEELQDIVEQVDMAQILNRFGGIQCLLTLLPDSKISSVNDDVRALAASVIATVAQNNIKVQDDMLSKNILSILVDLFESIESNMVCNKVWNVLIRNE